VNQYDAIAAVAAAITEAEALACRPLLEALTDPATGQVRPVTIVTDNGGPPGSPPPSTAVPSSATFGPGSGPPVRTGSGNAALSH